MTTEQIAVTDQIEEILKYGEDAGVRVISKAGQDFYIVSDIEDKFPEAFNAIRTEEAYEVANLVRVSNKSQQFEAWVISDAALQDLFEDLSERQQAELENHLDFAENTNEGEDAAPTTACAAGNPTAAHGGVTDIIVVDKNIQEDPSVDEDRTMKNIIKDYVRHYVQDILKVDSEDSTSVGLGYQEGYRVLFTAALTSQGDDVSRDLLQEFFALPASTCKLDWLIENGFGPSVLEAARRLFPIPVEDQTFTDEKSS